MYNTYLLVPIVTADRVSYNLRSGHKLQEEKELNLRDLVPATLPHV